MDTHRSAWHIGGVDQGGDPWSTRYHKGRDLGQANTHPSKRAVPMHISVTPSSCKGTLVHPFHASHVSRIDKSFECWLGSDFLQVTLAVCPLVL